jgi:hypothetical protein
MKKLLLLAAVLFASMVPQVTHAQDTIFGVNSKWEWKVPNRSCTVVLTLGADSSYRVDSYCKSGSRQNHQVRVGTFTGNSANIDISITQSTCVADATHYIFQMQLAADGSSLLIRTALEDANFLPVALDKQYFTTWVKRDGCFTPKYQYYTPGASGFVAGNLLLL